MTEFKPKVQFKKEVILWTKWNILSVPMFSMVEFKSMFIGDYVTSFPIISKEQRLVTMPSCKMGIYHY